MGWGTQVIFTTDKKITGKMSASAIEKLAEDKYINEEVLLEGSPYVENGCVYLDVSRGTEDKVIAAMKAIQKLYNVKIKKVRVEQVDYDEVPNWREIEDEFNGPFCSGQRGGAVKKRSAKKRSMKKRSTKKRSIKKRSIKKRSIKKRSIKKRSIKKRSL